MYKRPNGGRRIEGPVHDLHYRTGLYKGSFEDRNRPGGVWAAPRAMCRLPKNEQSSAVHIGGSSKVRTTDLMRHGSCHF